MAETLPAPPPASLLTPLTDPAGGNAMSRLKAFAGQGAVRKALPLFMGVSAIGLAALAWATLAPSPQRTLYGSLSDNERAGVVEALDKAGIAYNIDNNTGALTVNEADYYRARMLAASDGALAAPQSGQDMLDNMPMGASRTLEGERLRAAREHDLMLTIQEIDGVEAVRVHLAEGAKSVFVRDNAPPSASVMVRLASGRQLSQGQVAAIVNLVAASVPGMSPDAVRVADQHGRLLSDKSATAESDRLELQTRMEEKLRNQLSQLLSPIVGEGNFSSEIQVELDMNQVTSAKESYDKEGGVVRSETQQQSSTTAPGQNGGVPGVTSNTPPAAGAAAARPPQGTAPNAAGAPANGESSATRTYELGREVAVSNITPGSLKRLSVAVAISAKALKNNNTDLEQIKQLVSAAVGASQARGDQVAVVSREFRATEAEALPFYEAPWFMGVLRNAVALLAVLLVLLLGVRPLVKALKRDKAGEAQADATAAEAGIESGEAAALPGAVPAAAAVSASAAAAIDPAVLSEQVGLAQRLVAEKQDAAVAALRQMLGEEQNEAAA